MGDILIRGLNMPLSKTELIVCPSGVVQVYDSCENYLGKAEAVPLPEGHGRLGDLDAIVAEIEKQLTERDKIMELCKKVGDAENYFRCSNYQTAIVSFARMLNSAPTIVPAEGGGEDG